jgi:hypothetical protein
MILTCCLKPGQEYVHRNLGKQGAITVRGHSHQQLLAFPCQSREPSQWHSWGFRLLGRALRATTAAATLVFPFPSPLTPYNTTDRPMMSATMSLSFVAVLWTWPWLSTNNDPKLPKCAFLPCSSCKTPLSSS